VLKSFLDPVERIKFDKDLDFAENIEVINDSVMLYYHLNK
jgi:hypothetical protein